LLLINLPSLVNRRTILGTIFMNNPIRGDIDSVDLVSRLTFNVPVRLMRNYYPINFNYNNNPIKWQIFLVSPS